MADKGLQQATVTSITAGVFTVLPDGSVNTITLRSAIGLVAIGDRAAIQQVKGKIWIGFGVNAGASNRFPGEIVWGGWPQASIPPGTLLANGQAVSRSTYARLFAIMGTAYGVGDGSTTFNLPDYMGATDAYFRIPRGPALPGDILGSRNGNTVHSHPLSDAGQAAVGVATVSPFGWMRRVTSAAYSPTNTIGGTSASTTYSTSQSAGAALTGHTDLNTAGYDPYQVATAVIVY